MKDANWVSKNPPHDSRIKVRASKQVSLLRKQRARNSPFPQKAAANISPAFAKEAGKHQTTPSSYQLIPASLHSTCWGATGREAAFWSLAAIFHSYSQLYGEQDAVSWTTFHLSKTVCTHAWASHKIRVINEKSTQVNKEKIKREAWGSHIQLFALENLNEYSLRANYKMLTLKCWVAGRIMGYCTVKMPDSCMLSYYCVI